MHQSALALLLTTVPAIVSAQVPPSVDLEHRRKALDALLKEQWEYFLHAEPEYASSLGDRRYNDRLKDYSQAFLDSDWKQKAEFLKRFEAIDTKGFPLQEALNKELMVRDLRTELEGQRFKDWEMPLFPGMIHLALPFLASKVPLETVKDFEDYIVRLKHVPRVLAEATIQMRKGMRDGLMPPGFLLPKVVSQCEEIAAAKLEESPFTQPLTKFPATFSDAEKNRLKEGVLSAFKDQVVPAYRTFAAFVRDEYAPKGRKDPGIWALPDGEARYAYLVKFHTTTEYTPEQIHQTGLREVARIETRMLEVAATMGSKDLKQFNEAIQKNLALRPQSRQEILDLYTRYIEQAKAKLPQLFGRLPKSRIKVLPVEAFLEKDAPAAYYRSEAREGSRVGILSVNTGDFAERQTISFETTALHEGVPGHHMQASIAQELPELPIFRQEAIYNAHVEGWALYAERLGEEMGFFKDPYSFYGHLQDEMLRAIRLVVDTGLHYKKWTRQQVVDYFHAHSCLEEMEIQNETDRYINMPGQALSYKVGELKILELRDYVKKHLGPNFDIRSFHDEILGAGALPMDVLERRIKDWASRGQAGTPPQLETDHTR